eukprot:gnl/Dysnectes_brevis/2856_a3487_883.p1 GENE.gnl/Dysnectes_brevis/2856_a3487_883~~gnl/Dysnectes_brevis/2856_a3487_883.p1  ORF type:complete len:635 (+),score=141.03 gnl/Dysnectes_brevis/2856_a3487_883:564-2468(+)
MAFSQILITEDLFRDVEMSFKKSFLTLFSIDSIPIIRSLRHVETYIKLFNIWLKKGSRYRYCFLLPLCNDKTSQRVKEKLVDQDVLKMVVECMKHDSVSKSTVSSESIKAAFCSCSNLPIHRPALKIADFLSFTKKLKETNPQFTSHVTSAIKSIKSGIVSEDKKLFERMSHDPSLDTKYKRFKAHLSKTATKSTKTASTTVKAKSKASQPNKVKSDEIATPQTPLTPFTPGTTPRSTAPQRHAEPAARPVPVGRLLRRGNRVIKPRTTPIRTIEIKKTTSNKSLFNTAPRTSNGSSLAYPSLWAFLKIQDGRPDPSSLVPPFCPSEHVNLQLFLDAGRAAARALGSDAPPIDPPIPRVMGGMGMGMGMSMGNVGGTRESFIAAYNAEIALEDAIPVLAIPFSLPADPKRSDPHLRVLNPAPPPPADCSTREECTVDHPVTLLAGPAFCCPEPAGPIVTSRIASTIAASMRELPFPAPDRRPLPRNGVMLTQYHETLSRMDRPAVNVPPPRTNILLWRSKSVKAQAWHRHDWERITPAKGVRRFPVHMRRRGENDTDLFAPRQVRVTPKEGITSLRLKTSKAGPFELGQLSPAVVSVALAMKQPPPDHPMPTHSREPDHLSAYRPPSKRVRHMM